MIKEAEDGCPQFEFSNVALINIQNKANKALREWWEEQTVVFGDQKYVEDALWRVNLISPHFLKARLCGVKIIKKESAEDILRDIVSLYHNSSSNIHPLILRAKTFLENK